MGKRAKPMPKKKKILIIFEIIFILMLVVSLIGIGKWVIENSKNKKIKEEISQAVTIDETQTEEDTVKYNVDFESLKEKNSDTVAWLKVEGTDIEHVVVKGKNNSYYLTYNFEKKYNDAGWVFADYKNKFDGTDKNIIIYGHNRKDGSMFGTLKNILSEDWYNNEANRKITLITPEENSVYEVFSIYQIPVEDYYIKTEFTNKEFSKYIETVEKRSIKDFDVDVTEEDDLLTLSTCGNSNKYRVVLHAKKVVE